eukprot:350419-Chlamydomonas_euryale.AAC.4
MTPCVLVASPPLRSPSRRPRSEHGNAQGAYTRAVSRKPVVAHIHGRPARPGRPTEPYQANGQGRLPTSREPSRRLPALFRRAPTRIPKPSSLLSEHRAHCLSAIGCSTTSSVLKFLKSPQPSISCSPAVHTPHWCDGLLGNSDEMSAGGRRYPFGVARVLFGPAAHLAYVQPASGCMPLDETGCVGRVVRTLSFVEQTWLIHPGVVDSTTPSTTTRLNGLSHFLTDTCRSFCLQLAVVRLEIVVVGLIKKQRATRVSRWGTGHGTWWWWGPGGFNKRRGTNVSHWGTGHGTWTERPWLFCRGGRFYRKVSLCEQYEASWEVIQQVCFLSSSARPVAYHSDVSWGCVRVHKKSLSSQVWPAPKGTPCFSDGFPSWGKKTGPAGAFSKLASHEAPSTVIYQAPC